MVTMAMSCLLETRSVEPDSSVIRYIVTYRVQSSIQRISANSHTALNLRITIFEVIVNFILQFRVVLASKIVIKKNWPDHRYYFPLLLFTKLKLKVRQVWTITGTTTTEGKMPSYHDKATELEDLRELAAHGVLEVLSLHLSHLPTGEVKYFLAIGV